MSQIKHIDSTVFLANNDIIRAALKTKLTSVTTMPTLTDGIVGNTYLYTGATTVDFTTNTIYKAISDGGDPATLSWQSIELGAETIRYVQTIPTTGIENIIYGKLNLTDTLAITVEDVLPTDFTDLDSDDRFTKTGDIYTPANTEDIRVLYSEWTTSDYEKFVSLDVTDGQAMVLTTDKGSYEITTANATVTFKSVTYEYYSGDADNQTTKRLALYENIPDGVIVDNELSSTSENPVQNKIINSALNTKLTQVSTMPTCTSADVGKVVQYIGENDTVNNLVKGFFYRACVSESDPTQYEWVNQEVQESTDGEAKVNATAVTSLSGLADGFYLLIDSTATPIYQLKEIADGTATDSDKEVDTCLIDYVLYNDNKTVLDTLDIVWVVTGTPDISDYKTEFETAKSSVRINADYTFEWDSDVFSVGDFADLKSQWNAFAVFMHNNKGRLAMITIAQHDFGFSDDDTGGSSPTLICIIPDEVSIGEDYSIRIPYGSATSTHCDGYGFGFIDINWRLNISLGKCELAGINTILFKGTDSMSTGYAYTSSGASSVYINEAEYSMNDPTEKAAAYNLYHQGVTITVKLL